ncbi:hypothetical protein ACVXG7_07265 [Enterobacter hormaechei]
MSRAGGNALKKSPGRLDFQRGILGAQRRRRAGGEHHRASGFAHLSSFSQGNCFIVLERDRGHVEAGEWVEVERFNHLFGG